MLTGEEHKATEILEASKTGILPRPINKKLQSFNKNNNSKTNNKTGEEESPINVDAEADVKKREDSEFTEEHRTLLNKMGDDGKEHPPDIYEEVQRGTLIGGLRAFFSEILLIKVIQTSTCAQYYNSLIYLGLISTIFFSSSYSRCFSLWFLFSSFITLNIQSTKVTGNYFRVNAPFTTAGTDSLLCTGVAPAIEFDGWDAKKAYKYYQLMYI